MPSGTSAGSLRLHGQLCFLRPPRPARRAHDAPDLRRSLPGVVLEGSILPEPVEVLALVPMGASLRVIGKGLRTGQVRDPILDPAQFAQLTLSPKDSPFDGDPLHFKLGVAAARLELAYARQQFSAIPPQVRGE